MTPFQSLKAFGAAGARVGPTDMTTTAAAVIIPAASVHYRNARQFGFWRKRRRNTKQLTGESENTSAPKTLQWSLPWPLIWSVGVVTGSITKGPEARKLIAIIVSSNGPARDALPC